MKLINNMSPTSQSNTWEEEFENKRIINRFIARFLAIQQTLITEITDYGLVSGVDNEIVDLFRNTNDEYKSFISQLLLSEHQRLREEVEKMKIENTPHNLSQAIYHGERGEALMEGYNKAIKIVLDFLSQDTNNHE